MPKRSTRSHKGIKRIGRLFGKGQMARLSEVIGRYVAPPGAAPPAEDEIGEGDEEGEGLEEEGELVEEADSEAEVLFGGALDEPPPEEQEELAVKAS